MNLLGLICVITITIFVPPLGVLLVAGCGGDLLVNIIFTLLGYFPGHIHAFYVIFVYYYRKEQRRKGIPVTDDAIGIFSEKVQYGGHEYQRHEHRY